MSALPPKADMDQSGCDVRFVPKADITRRRKMASLRYSITTSASESSFAETSRPSALAVFILISSSNLVGS
jgi:hypothetical protein